MGFLHLVRVDSLPWLVVKIATGVIILLTGALVYEKLHETVARRLQKYVWGPLEEPLMGHLKWLASCAFTASLVNLVIHDWDDAAALACLAVVLLLMHRARVAYQVDQHAKLKREMPELAEVSMGDGGVMELMEAIIQRLLKAHSHNAKRFHHGHALNLRLVRAVEQGVSNMRDVAAGSLPVDVVKDALAQEHLTETAHYLRYAAAAYSPMAGDDGRQQNGHANWDSSAALCDCLGLNAADLVLTSSTATDVDCNYFIAIDTSAKAIVLAIGPQSRQSFVDDLICPAEPFYGGLAHASMAGVAQALKAIVTPKLSCLMREHSGFNVVITGHSIGAGIATLLTLSILFDVRRRSFPIPVTTKIRCFAYAPPPVFTPLEAAPFGLLDAVTAVVHEGDVVPHISRANSLRLLRSMSAIDDLRLSLLRCDLIAHDFQTPPAEMAEAVSNVAQQPLQDTRAPDLLVPAKAIIWLTSRDGEYRARACSAAALSVVGLHLSDSDVIKQHIPRAYEEALKVITDRF
mmetsp:Transcript_54910/g.98629  ORF Transcript_54910/g.98629 Transcript_54910/m.98629 type:complete len:518 (+) Transcript_54910:55-1608(+)